MTSDIDPTWIDWPAGSLNPPPIEQVGALAEQFGVTAALAEGALTPARVRHNSPTRNTLNIVSLATWPRRRGRRVAGVRSAEIRDASAACRRSCSENLSAVLVMVYGMLTGENGLRRKGCMPHAALSCAATGRLR
jgi:hypothetical protein